MKAAFLVESGKIEVRTIEKPLISNTDVLLKVKSCAICGSDLRIFKTGNARITFPQIIGHEIAGEVIEVGNEVNSYSIGDNLSLAADIPCGSCFWCKEKKFNSCDNTLAFGYEYQGGFAEYLVLNQRILEHGPIVKYPSHFSSDLMCLAEPIACCINGLEKVEMSSGKSILISGAGPIGIIIGLLANITGASKIFFSDFNEDRLAMVKELIPSAHIISLQSSSLKEFILKETLDEGVDIVMTACPSIDAQRESFSVIRKNGFINFFGGLPQGSDLLGIDSNSIHYHELHVVGSHGSTPEQHKKAALTLQENTSIFQKIISKKYNLDNISEAFEELFHNQKLLKIIINP